MDERRMIPDLREYNLGKKLLLCHNYIPNGTFSTTPSLRIRAFVFMLAYMTLKS